MVINGVRPAHKSVKSSIEGRLKPQPPQGVQSRGHKPHKSMAPCNVEALHEDYQKGSGQYSQLTKYR